MMQIELAAIQSTIEYRTIFLSAWFVRQINYIVLSRHTLCTQQSTA